MSLGTGIFLASIVLGLVYLYINTRETWNWGKITKRAGQSVLGVLGVIFLGIGALYVYESIDKPSVKAKDSKPGVVSSLEGISIGDRLSDVEFRLGSKKDREQQPGDEIFYELTSKTNVKFNINRETKLVTMIAFECTNDAFSYPNLYSFSVHGVKCGMSSDEILSRYEPRSVRVLCYYKEKGKEDSVINAFRAYDIPKYGIRYILSTNQVTHVVIRSPEQTEAAILQHWKPCQ